MSFDGFDRTALSLLAVLPEWSGSDYAAEKARLKAGVVDPGGLLIEEVAAVMKPDLTVVRRSSVSPLHRDLRFAAQGTPRYKDHLLLTAWHGSDKKFAPTLWIRIDAAHAGFASGMAFDPKARDRWRAAVGADSGAVLARAIDKIVKSSAKNGVDVAGDQLKKVPPPWPVDHPRGDLLRRGSFQIRLRESLPKSVDKPAFASWCAARLARLLPVHEWLVKHVAQ
jgi:hypothetical protein